MATLAPLPKQLFREGGLCAVRDCPNAGAIPNMKAGWMIYYCPAHNTIVRGWRRT